MSEVIAGGCPLLRDAQALKVLANVSLGQKRLLAGYSPLFRISRTVEVGSVMRPIIL